jgi:molecular chaperone GrpE (heat shock protein)
MTKDHPQRLAEVAGQLQELRECIEQLQYEEQESFESLSECLQQGVFGQALEQAAEQMGTVLDSIDEAVYVLEKAHL